MLLVVADTSPIRYLVQIGHVEVLPLLFEQVSIPVEVANELRNASAPPAILAWMQDLPAWLKIVEVTETSDPETEALDPGERSALALGLALKADLILIDERKGTAMALKKGFETTGTLGVLDLAARRGFIDLKAAIESLKRTNFRYRRDVIDSLLAQDEATR